VGIGTYVIYYGSYLEHYQNLEKNVKLCLGNRVKKFELRVLAVSSDTVYHSLSKNDPIVM
jgi:hypothetical protein